MSIPILTVAHTRGARLPFSVETWVTSKPRSTLLLHEWLMRLYMSGWWGWILRALQTWMSRVTHVDGSRHTSRHMSRHTYRVSRYKYEWVMSRMQTSHVHILRRHGGATSHIQPCPVAHTNVHVTHANASCDAYECVMPRMQTSHVHIRMYHITHNNESQPYLEFRVASPYTGSRANVSITPLNLLDNL